MIMETILGRNPTEKIRYCHSVNVLPEPVMSVGGKGSNVMEITHASIARCSSTVYLLAPPLQALCGSQANTARLYVRRITGKEKKNASYSKHGSLGEQVTANGDVHCDHRTSYGY